MRPVQREDVWDQMEIRVKDRFGARQRHVDNRKTPYFHPFVVKEERTQVVFDKAQILGVAAALAQENLIVPVGKGRRITVGIPQVAVKAFLDTRPIRVEEVIQDYQSVTTYQLSGESQIGARMCGGV